MREDQIGPPRNQSHPETADGSTTAIFPKARPAGGVVFAFDAGRLAGSEGGARPAVLTVMIGTNGDKKFTKRPN